MSLCSFIPAAMVVLSVPLAIAGLIIIVISELLYIHQKMEGECLGERKVILS